MLKEAIKTDGVSTLVLLRDALRAEDDDRTAQIIGFLDAAARLPIDEYLVYQPVFCWLLHCSPERLFALVRRFQVEEKLGPAIERVMANHDAAERQATEESSTVRSPGHLVIRALAHQIPQ